MNELPKKPLDLSELRREIDRIDAELVSLFSHRMQVCASVAEYKRHVGMPVSDPAREAALLERVAKTSPAETADYTRTLYANILSLSRAYQHVKLETQAPFVKDIKEAAAHTAKELPKTATVACQGTAGAYSCKAAKKLFEAPDIHHYEQFCDVFSAIEQGECRYGVLPIENSTAGSVTEIYDLMSKHRFYIVRAVRLSIDHCLLAKRGTKIEDIKEIVSHKHALAQCTGLLKNHPNIKAVAMENTAVAARYAAESEGVAAIADMDCAALYDLDIIEKAISDTTNNCTRFICISKDPEILEGADKTSLILTLAHRPGALSRILTRFDALSINLTKLESRPIPERDFEFRFYFDFVAPFAAPNLSHLLSELSGEHEDFRYLGTYSEIE